MPDSTDFPEETDETINSAGPDSRRLALLVEYDGTDYAGFQFQSSERSIQGEIERSLTQFTGESIRIRGASRTDSGAHAQGQVVDFLTCSRHHASKFPPALNFYLEQDIKIQAAAVVPIFFDARRDAVSRVYSYSIFNRRWPSPLVRNTHLWVREQLDVAKMADEAQSLLGRHDFRVFSPGFPAEKSAVRQVDRWEVWREKDEVMIKSEANGFMRHQIRRTNSLLIEVGRGRYPQGSVKGVLDGVQKLEWATIPARGLCLMKVNYREIDSPAWSNNEAD